MKRLLLLIVAVAVLMGCTQQPPQPGQWQIEGRTSHRYGIFIMDADGTNVRQVYGSDLSVSNAVPSPDGTRIAFYEQEGGIQAGLDTIYTSEIAMIDIDGAGYRKLTDNDWMDFQPRWKPDGSGILFISTGGRKTGTDIYVMEPDGNVTKRLTVTPVLSEADPDWRCGKIVFTRNHSVWIMDEDGSNEMELTDPPGRGTDVGVQFPLGDYDPNLSPDCTKVVFERLTGPGLRSGETNIGDYDLYVYDIGTGTEIDISRNGGADFVPKWSALLSRILFIHVTDNPADAYDIYAVNPDGTGRAKITGNDPDTFLENGCSWLGDRILFTAEFYG
jgi:Tol biopolymer transport system component